MIKNECVQKKKKKKKERKKEGQIFAIFSTKLLV